MTTIVNSLKAVALLVVAENLSPGILRQVADSYAASQARAAQQGEGLSEPAPALVPKPAIAARAGMLAAARRVGLTRWVTQHRMTSGWLGRQRAAVVTIEVIDWPSLAFLLAAVVLLVVSVVWAVRS